MEAAINEQLNGCNCSAPERQRRRVKSELSPSDTISDSKSWAVQSKKGFPERRIVVGVKRDGYQKERYLEHCPVVVDYFIVGRVWNGGSQNEKSPFEGHNKQYTRVA